MHSRCFRTSGLPCAAITWLIVGSLGAKAFAQGTEVGGESGRQNGQNGQSEPSAPSSVDLSQARSWFQEGVALSAANNCAAALPKFRAVAGVRMTSQVAFNLAECEERLGRLVQALGSYRVAAKLANVTNASNAAQANDVIRVVGERISAIEARVPKLQVTRGAHAERATLELDGETLGENQLGHPIPVDPGPHVIVAKVEGQRVFERSVELAEKGEALVAVVLDAPSPVAPAPLAPRRETNDANEDVWAKYRTPSFVLMGAGAASIVVGAVMLGLRQGAQNDLEKLCGGDSTCPPSAEPVASKGRIYTGVAEVTMPLGVLSAGAGLFFFFKSGGFEGQRGQRDQRGERDQRDPGSSAQSKNVWVLPTATNQSVGMTAFGRF